MGGVKRVEECYMSYECGGLCNPVCQLTVRVIVVSTIMVEGYKSCFCNANYNPLEKWNVYREQLM